MKTHHSLDNTSRCRLVRLIVMAAVVATLLASLGVDTAEAQGGRRGKSRKSGFQIRVFNHIPPIVIDDGSMVVETERKLRDPQPVGGRHRSEYPVAFQISRVKVFDGEGERLFPATATGTCARCRIEVWFRELQSDPQVVVEDSAGLAITTDLPIAWDSDPNQQCQPNTPCRCKPTNRARSSKHSHPGYAGQDSHFQKIVVRRAGRIVFQTPPPDGHPVGYRIMIWN